MWDFLVAVYDMITESFTTEKVEEIHEYDREEKTTGESIGLWLGIGASVVAILGFVLQMCSRK